MSELVTSNGLKSAVKQILGESITAWIRQKRNRWRRWPPVGWVRFGSLRSVQPIARAFGRGYGWIIDRYYIENFLSQHRGDIRGSVLEIGSNVYTVRFGQAVTSSDVLHVIAGNPQATIVADLTKDEGLPECRFDCMILTQTLQFIYDVPAAIRTVHRILRPGGVVLCTVPGISKISVYDQQRWGDYWRFTTMSIGRLFESVFPPDSVQVRAHGNVLAATAFLQGMVVEDVTPGELDFHDPEYELMITIRAVKPPKAGLQSFDVATNKL